MEIKTLKDLKKNEYFRKVNKDGKLQETVYVKGDYVRSLKKFSTYKYFDVNDEKFMKSDTIVSTDFIF